MFTQLRISTFLFSTRCYSNSRNVSRIRPKVKPIRHSGPPFITCTKAKYDLHLGDKINKSAAFGNIPLLSDNWMSRKSKGDSFTIHPHRDADKETVLSSDYNEPFESFGLHPDLVENVKNRLNLRTATYAQHTAIPTILNNKHALIAAETGCGKTIAYLLPILQHLLQSKRENVGAGEVPFNAPRAMIITPSRELTQQISDVCEQLSVDTGLTSHVVIGGHMKSFIRDAPMDNVDILIGSIGGLSKVITNNVYKMNAVRHVVLDEADTLLDESFVGKLRYILKRFPFHNIVRKPNDSNALSTQLIMASATMPTNIETSMETIIDTSTLEHVVSPYLHRMMPHITQKFVRIGRGHRPFELLKIAKTMADKKRPLIVFANTRQKCLDLTDFLNDNDVECAGLTKDDFNGLRSLQFERFQKGQVHVLCSTDLSSRGLDTRRAHHVLNYDFPRHIADYIHRCGRIGRANSLDNCRVTSFVCQFYDIPLVQQIEHSARTERILPNVNANIAGTLENRRIHRENKENKSFFDELKQMQPQ